MAELAALLRAVADSLVRPQGPQPPAALVQPTTLPALPVVVPVPKRIIVQMSAPPVVSHLLATAKGKGKGVPTRVVFFKGAGEGVPRVPSPPVVPPPEHLRLRTKARFLCIFYLFCAPHPPFPSQHHHPRLLRAVHPRSTRWRRRPRRRRMWRRRRRRWVGWGCVFIVSFLFFVFLFFREVLRRRYAQLQEQQACKGKNKGKGKLSFSKGKNKAKNKFKGLAIGARPPPSPPPTTLTSH